jgi:hypothetical protein
VHVVVLVVFLVVVVVVVVVIGWVSRRSARTEEEMSK